MATVLISDDSAFMRMILKRTLTAVGHQVIGEATNGLEAVELYQSLHPDITTMDITMPEMDGLEALKRIRAADSTAKVVMVSAIGQQEFILEALQAGASDFLVKPFEQEQVSMIVSKALRL